MDSAERLDTNRDDAIALCSGNRDTQLLNSTGNLLKSSPLKKKDEFFFAAH